MFNHNSKSATKGNPALLVRLAITILALGLVLAHTLFPQIAIDSPAITLLLIASFPWLAPLLRSFEVPGVLKVEFLELVAAAKKAEDAGLASVSMSSTSKNRHTYTFERMAPNNPGLAIAALQIEIELRLRNIAQSHGLTPDYGDTQLLIGKLENRKVLERDEVAALGTLLPLLKLAAYSSEVDAKTSNWALEFGPRLLAGLDERLGMAAVPKLIEQWRARDGGIWLEVGPALSKAFVASPRAFLHAMKNDPASFTSWLQGLDTHTFKLFGADDDLDHDLQGAYHERLRQLMCETATRFIDSEYRAEAKQLFDTLNSIEISRIY